MDKFQRLATIMATQRKQRSRLERGFTITELAIVIGIVAILFSFVLFSMTRVQSNASITAVTEEVVAEIKLQQEKAMQGALTNGTTVSAYGIYFESDQYTVFAGETYDPSAPSNITTRLDPPIIFTDIQAPGDAIIFDRISGEFLGYSAGNSTVTIRHEASGEERTITLNQLGVITGVE